MRCDETVAKPARRFRKFETFPQALVLSQPTGYLGSEDLFTIARLLAAVNERSVSQGINITTPALGLRPS